MAAYALLRVMRGLAHTSEVWIGSDEVIRRRGLNVQFLPESGPF
jgi:hypothetical protein